MGNHSGKSEAAKIEADKETKIATAKIEADKETKIATAKIEADKDIKIATAKIEADKVTKIETARMDKDARIEVARLQATSGELLLRIVPCSSCLPNPDPSSEYPFA
jgi:5-hydroxyisourate hydrolase-like protein (transthyretin family)